MNNSKRRSLIVIMITFILTVSVTALRPVHADDDDGPEYTISKLNITTVRLKKTELSD